MRQAVFITGFNNWGKTWIIQHFFHRKKFYQGWHYVIPGINARFTVESHSNDDWWGQEWSNHVQNRINNEQSENLNLFTALCPTIHNNNNFADLLSAGPFLSYDRLHLFLIEFKWDHHAQLMINNITNSGSRIPNINFINIDADRNLTTDRARWDAKIDQIRQHLQAIFP